MFELALYACVGALSGLTAGLFGIGGGLVIVPVLLLVFEFKDYSSEVLAHMAVATSLAAIIFNSISAAYNQHKRQAVAWSRWRLVPLLLLGSILGAAIAGAVSGNSMRVLLAVFLFFIALYMLRKKKQSGSAVIRCKGPCAQLAGGAIGTLSAIVGIAGGTFLVPLLHALGHPMRVAVGTSSALGVPLVSVAALSHIFTGYGNPSLPEWTLGYVYIPAFLGITLVSPWSARFGVVLGHSLDQEMLRRCFAVFLLGSAAWVLLRLYLI